MLEKLFAKYLDPCLQFMRRNCSEMVQTPNNNLVCSLLRILDCFFKPYWDTDAKKVTAEEIEELEGMLEPLFVYAVIWSIDCTTDPEGREKFGLRIKELLGKDNEHKFPSGGSVYDYAYNKDVKEWTVWTETVDPFSIQVDLPLDVRFFRLSLDLSNTHDRFLLRFSLQSADMMRGRPRSGKGKFAESEAGRSTGGGNRMKRSVVAFCLSPAYAGR